MKHLFLFLVSAHCYAAHAPSGHWYAAATDEDEADSDILVSAESSSEED